MEIVPLHILEVRGSYLDYDMLIPTEVSRSFPQLLHTNAGTVLQNMGCPNKSARFKVRAIFVLLGWRH